MNRYLIAALYVMAGCVVAIPLKVQGGPESLKGERCRLVVASTVKVVSAYLDSKVSEQTFSDLPSDCFYVPKVRGFNLDYSFDRSVLTKVGGLCSISHKIRAPGGRRSLQ